MQPAFPHDHHFHRARARRPAPLPRGEDVAAEAQRALEYLRRQFMPAFDASDPRGHGSPGLRAGAAGLPA